VSHRNQIDFRAAQRRPNGKKFRGLKTEVGMPVSRPEKGGFETHVLGNSLAAVALKTDSYDTGGVMETLDPVEALKLIRKLAIVAAGSNELGYLKTTVRDVLRKIDRALPPDKRNQLRGH
jgi:hypothetical protein